MNRKWLGISLSLHLGFLSFLASFKRKPGETVLQIVPISEKDLQTTIIHENFAKKTKTPVKNARLGKENRKTEIETVKKPAPAAPDEIPAQDGFGSAPKSVTTKGKFNPNKTGNGVSASDDFIQGAEIGPMTILNSQEYKYFSYYDRIRQAVVETWRPLIRKAIKTVKNNPKKYGELGLGWKTTKLELLLNAKGEVISLSVKQSSGYTLFDEAGDKAFRQSAPFAAPPKELIKDGQFVLRWDFVVSVEDAGLIQYNTGKVK